MQLSVCIITKNEEKKIACCLESLLSREVEIVVVDTGSIDGTKAVASEYTDKLYDFAWCDDFAKVKNFAISKASNQYVLILDSDEYIEEFDGAAVSHLLQQHPNAVGRIQRRNIFFRKGQKQENHEWINRVFAKDKFHYVGRIHEQVTSLVETEYETYLTPIVIGHTGYDLPEEALKEKAKRNRKLLEQELARLLLERGVLTVLEDAAEQPLPDDKNQIPYIVYQLGKSCYMAGDYAEACEFFSQGLSYDLNPKLEYVIDMVETYGYALINSGRANEALFFENIYEEFGDSADFKFLMGLIYMNNECFDEAVSEFLKATECETSRSQGVNSYAAFYNIGVICECLDHLDEACKYYKKCGEYEPAKKRLSTLK